MSQKTKDWNRPAKTAERLINKYGREVSIIRFTDTPGNPSQSWRGPSAPRTTVDVAVTAKAVFVGLTDSDWGTMTISDDLKKRSEKICMISPGESTITENLATFTQILDADSTRWNITGVETLEPGDKKILYMIGVKR